MLGQKRGKRCASTQLEFRSNVDIHIKEPPGRRAGRWPFFVLKFDELLQFCRTRYQVGRPPGSGSQAAVQCRG